MTENEIASIVIGCAIDVHRILGPGLLESAYKECLHYELNEKGIYVEREKPMPLIYKEVKLDHGYRMDLVAEDKLGLIINFNTKLLKDGIKRIIN